MDGMLKVLAFCMCLMSASATVTRCVSQTCHTRRFLFDSITDTTNNRYCELFVNSAGLQGSCRSIAWRAAHINLPSCHKGQVLKSGDHCYCSVQLCANDLLHNYEAHHTTSHASHTNTSHNVLTCGGDRCHASEEVCIISDDKETHCGHIGRHNHCYATNTVTTHSTATHHGGGGQAGHLPSHWAARGCYCDTQSCIDSYHLHANVKDTRVQCGSESTCYIRHGMACILSNTGRTHTYHGVTFHTDNRCVNTTGRRLPNRCTVGVQLQPGESCYCQNQICVNNHTKAVEFDSHVNCGNDRCHVHSGSLCILTLTESSHRYRGEDADRTDGRLVTYVEQHCSERDHGHSSTTVPSCESRLTLGQSCSCASNKCMQMYSIETLSPLTTVAPTTSMHTTHAMSTKEPATTLPAVTSTAIPTTTKTTTTTKPTTTSTTTTLPTTAIVYPDCPGYDCSHLYLRYCHLYIVDSAIEGRCMPFKVGTDCLSDKDLQGNGCTCSESVCTNQILSTFYKNHPDLTTTSTTLRTETTTEQMATTTKNGFGCLTDTCDLAKLWADCRTRTDVGGGGCTCHSGYCAEAVEKNSEVDATTQSTTTEESFINPHTTLEPHKVSTELTHTNLKTSTTPVIINSPESTTIKEERTTHGFQKMSTTPVIINSPESTTIKEERTTHGFQKMSTTPVIINSPESTTIKEETTTHGFHKTSTTSSTMSSPEPATIKIDRTTQDFREVSTTQRTVSSPESTTIKEEKTTQHLQETSTIQTVTDSPESTSIKEQTTTEDSLESPTPYIITNSPETTTTNEMTTTQGICQDKPGVDCLILNSTNICANPFSHEYCAAFCGHCKPKILSTFG